MNESNQSAHEETALEVMPPSASLAIETASINSQISTAKAYPRSLQVFKKRAIDMACLDEETAESCLYRRPVGGGKFAEGMSVRMSEIVGASYGNLRVQATIVEQTERFVRARGMAIDLESNFASSSECIESTVKKDGTPYDERMRVVIAKSALSKARRDAMFQVVPRALAKPVENAVRALLMGDTKTIEARRQLVVQWIAKTGIGSERVYAALGIKGEADLGVEQLETLTGIRTALKDSEITLDEAFPAVGEPVKRADPKPRAKTGAASVQENVTAPKTAAEVGGPGPTATDKKGGSVVEGELMPGDPATPAVNPVVQEAREEKQAAAEPTAKETVAAPVQRAKLQPDEKITVVAKVISVVTGFSPKDNQGIVEARIDGGFYGPVYHFGGAALPVGDEDPVPDSKWTAGNTLRLGLFGHKLKSGKVQARVESVEVMPAKATIETE